MKILVISNMYPTEENKSFGIFVKNQVEALEKRGLLVDVAAITNPRSGKLQVMKKYLLWMLRILKVFILRGGKYSIVHAHYVFPSGLWGYFFKKIRGTRFIVTAHGGDIDKMARKSPFFFKWTKKILQEADHIIAVGNELYGTIVNEFEVPEQKVSIINMGVNRDVFKPLNKELARKACGLEENIIPVLFVGNIIKQKGLLELCSAFSKLIVTEPGLRLYLIGPQKDQNFNEELNNYLQAHNILQYVQFLGVKDQKEIAQWMSAAEIFVLPSHIEGFGLVALEAMACGTAVVGTNVGGLKYLLADGAGHVVPAKESDALFKAILYLIRNQDVRNSLIENGEKRAEENDQERMLDYVMDVYFPTGG